MDRGHFPSRANGTTALMVEFTRSRFISAPSRQANGRARTGDQHVLRRGAVPALLGSLGVLKTPQ